MLGNAQNKDSVKEENKKLNFWFWIFSGFAVISAIVFIFAAISLLGVIFPEVFGGLSAIISRYYLHFVFVRRKKKLKVT